MSYLNALYEEGHSVQINLIIFLHGNYISCNWPFSHYPHHDTNNPENINCFNFDKLITLP